MSLDPTRALPTLKPFSLTHILYDPIHPLSIPLTLLSLTPIFLFVSYFTLLIFTRRLTILLLGLGSIANEALSLILKKWLKGDRPYKGLLGLGDVGEGYGMPSSHAQAAGFLLAWGVGYALDIEIRRKRESRPFRQTSVDTKPIDQGIQTIRTVRKAIILFGLGLWSVLVAYSR
jgi:dolichyldiphosphatase